MKDYRSPYLHVAAPTLEMKGKGAPRSTVFGMLGVGGGARGGVADGVKSLGGLVRETTKVKVNDKTMASKSAPCMERECFTKHATKMPMARGGLYPGYFMSHVGKML